MAACDGVEAHGAKGRHRRHHKGRVRKGGPGASQVADQGADAETAGGEVWFLDGSLNKRRDEKCLGEKHLAEKCDAINGEEAHAAMTLRNCC